jgi:glucose-6-phosphate isomerase
MLGWGGELPEPSVRTVEDMRPVLAEPSCERSGPLYFMYRDLARTDADWR